MTHIYVDHLLKELWPLLNQKLNSFL